MHPPPLLLPASSLPLSTARWSFYKVKRRFTLSNLVHIPQHGDPSKHWSNSPRQNLSCTLLEPKSVWGKIWSNPDRNLSDQLCNFLVHILPKDWAHSFKSRNDGLHKVDVKIFCLAENQTCPGVAPFTTSIRPFAPEANPPTVKTTPATFGEDRYGLKPPDLRRKNVGLWVGKDLFDPVVVSHCFHLSGEFFGCSRVDLVEEVFNFRQQLGGKIMTVHLNCHLDPLHLLGVEHFLGDSSCAPRDPTC